MKLHFDSNQKYQIDAIKSITDIFEGQPLSNGEFEFSMTSNGTLLSENGFGNHLLLDKERIWMNVQTVQERNEIKAPAKELLEMNFSVEMETDTGKTYVQLRTIYELLQPYTSTQNQYIFLNALSIEAANALTEHRKTCTKLDCGQTIGFDYLAFAIKQELDVILVHYAPSNSGNKDKISTEEKLETNQKIDPLLDHLNCINLGQQILFEEMNTLREHFDLDKKSWVQLLK